MARKPLPYYPFYVDAFDEGVLSMNLAEVGLYILALGHSWKHGSIPDDPGELARLIRRKPSEVRKAWPKVKQKWTETASGKLVNQRQELERLKAIEKSAQAARAVRTRYQSSTDVGAGVSSDESSDEHTSALLRASESVCLSISSEITTPNSEKTSTRETFENLPFDTLDSRPVLVKPPVDQWFADEFWPLYWRKVDRANALKAFKKAVDLRGDALLTEARKCKIIAAVKAQTPQYMARDSEHRPHAATWLNARRYEEDPEVFEPAKSKLERIMEAL